MGCDAIACERGASVSGAERQGGERQRARGGAPIRSCNFAAGLAACSPLKVWRKGDENEEGLKRKRPRKRKKEREKATGIWKEGD